MAELGDSLERMSFVQLLLLFGFVTCYVLAIGGLFGSTVRLRAAGLALLQAGAFTALTDPWVHGALFMAFAVAGLGLFVLLSWLLARALGPRQALPLPPETQAGGTASSLSQPSRHDDEPAAVADLPGRARVAR
ncbi:MAG: hypothetical protein KF720_21745 [Rubrivivax sp.]|nr:hypothetical protein [Rubrivivax sp.]